MAPTMRLLRLLRLTTINDIRFDSSFLALLVSTM